jgi:hypothetical protein
MKQNGEVVENKKKRVAVMVEGLKVIVSDLNKNYMLKIEKDGEVTYKAWLNPATATQKINQILGLIVEPLRYLNCEVAKKVGEKTYYTGTIEVQGVEVEVGFNQVEGKRYFVNGYHVAKDKQSGDNVTTYLKERGIEITRKELFDNLKQAQQ